MNMIIERERESEIGREGETEKQRKTREDRAGRKETDNVIKCMGFFFTSVEWTPGSNKLTILPIE